MSTPEASLRRKQLRAATADGHARVDALFPDGLTTTDAYRCFLQGMHRLCADTAKAWHGSAAVACTHADARVDLLAADLAHFGHAPLPPGPPLVLCGELELLGAEYVIQGSRVGARMLVRQVQAMGHGPDSGAGFLHWQAAPHGDAAWQVLLESIAGRAVAIEQQDALMAAAIRTFSAAAFAIERARNGVHA